MRRHEWTADQVFRLQELWESGATGLRCARLLNAEFDIALSRDAVIAKARRLDLQKRPSPLGRIKKMTA